MTSAPPTATPTITNTDGTPFPQAALIFSPCPRSASQKYNGGVEIGARVCHGVVPLGHQVQVSLRGWIATLVGMLKSETWVGSAAELSWRRGAMKRTGLVRVLVSFIMAGVVDEASRLCFFIYALKWRLFGLGFIRVVLCKANVLVISGHFLRSSGATIHVLANAGPWIACLIPSSYSDKRCPCPWITYYISRSRMWLVTKKRKYKADCPVNKEPSSSYHTRATQI